jgi:predicted nucleotide-binding protein
MKSKEISTTRRSRVFIGSSTETLPIAKALRDALLSHADVLVWHDAFHPGEMLLSAIVNLVSQYDFGVFIFSPDDELRIRKFEYTAVRDNVLFEAGVFMGGLGPQRTFLVTVKKSGKNQRMASDLAGFVTAGRAISKGSDKWDVMQPAKQIQRVVESLGPALRNSHNEILGLKTVLNEQKIGKRKFYLGELVRYAALIRPNQWITISDPLDLMEQICKKTNTMLQTTHIGGLLFMACLCLRESSISRRMNLGIGGNLLTMCGSAKEEWLCSTNLGENL